MKLNTDTKNLSHTRQRDAIFSVLKEARRPLTRSEILELGRKQVPRLGSATVDRAIREFTELKKIVGVHYPGQPKRYELPSSKEHPHFICRRCSRLFDLEGVMELPEVDVPAGFIINGGEIVYSGFCAACNDKA